MSLFPNQPKSVSDVLLTIENEGKVYTRNYNTIQEFVSNDSPSEATYICMRNVIYQSLFEIYGNWSGNLHIILSKVVERLVERYTGPEGLATLHRVAPQYAILGAAYEGPNSDDIDFLIRERSVITSSKQTPTDIVAGDWVVVTRAPTQAELQNSRIAWFTNKQENIGKTMCVSRVDAKVAVLSRHYYPLCILQKITNESPIQTDFKKGNELSYPLSVLQQVIQTTEKELQMAQTIKAVEQKTFIYGLEASTISDDVIFQHISNLEGQIKTLEAIETKPKALVKKIDGLKDDIKLLVELSDARQA